MEIVEKKDVNSIELEISGRLDTNTAPTLENKIKHVSGSTQNLYLNLSGVEYISSAGLRVVLLAHKSMLPAGGKMIIKSPSDFCMQVFKATGMDGVLSIE